MIFPFGTKLAKYLDIDGFIMPKASVDYFYNIIKRFKDDHCADETVSISPAEGLGIISSLNGSYQLWSKA